MPSPAHLALMGAKTPAAAGGFNPETDITWHSLFWAEGSDFLALGLADTDAVTTWPNETGETDATGSGPTYSAEGMNGVRPSVTFTTRGIRTASFASAPDYTSGVSIVAVVSQADSSGDRRVADGIAGRNIVYSTGTGYGIYAGGFVPGASNSHEPFYSSLVVGWFDGGAANDWIDVDDVRSATGAAGAGQITGLTIGADQSGDTVIPWKGEIALLGIYEGDVTADPAWADFVAWVTDHYTRIVLSSPAEISDLVGWWDASDAGTITESGGAVSQWDDKSGNGLHVSQSTGTKKPTTGVATQNGLNVISFDSTDWLKKSGHTPIMGSGGTLFFVFRKTGTANAYESAPLTLTAGNNPRPSDYWNTGSFGGLTSVRQNGATVVGYNVATSTTWSQVTFAVASGGSTTSQVVTIASRDDEVTQLTGDIAEIVAYNRTLTVLERDAVETYLATKWGL